MAVPRLLQSYIHQPPPIVLGKYKYYAQIAKLCNNMPQDLHEPSRYRLYRNFKLINGQLNATNVTEFFQEDRPNRVFKLIPSHYLRFITPMIQSMFEQYSHHYDRPENYDVNVHLVRQWAPAGLTSTNAPEGCHQDGADFIVSACVLNLENVEGGISKVYNETQSETLISHQLQPGEYLLHDDSRYWHDITKIQSKDKLLPATRDLIGIDFNRI